MSQWSDVIVAAAGSDRGLLALIILALWSTAMAWFRRAPVRVRVGVFLTLFFPVALFATAVAARHVFKSDDLTEDRGEAPSVPAAPPNNKREVISPVGAPSNIKLYTNDRFIGQPIYIEAGFAYALDRVNAYARHHGLYVWVIGSFREHVAPAVITGTPTNQRLSNHHIGHAVDFNLLYEGRFYRSVELRRLDEQPEQIRAFIDALRSDGVIRWGGDFSTADPVHLDDGFFIRDQQAARQIWEQIEALQASARVRA